MNFIKQLNFIKQCSYVCIQLLVFYFLYGGILFFVLGQTNDDIRWLDQALKSFESAANFKALIVLFLVIKSLFTIIKYISSNYDLDLSTDIGSELLSGCILTLLSNFNKNWLIFGSIYIYLFCIICKAIFGMFDKTVIYGTAIQQNYQSKTQLGIDKDTFMHEAGHVLIALLNPDQFSKFKVIITEDYARTEFILKTLDKQAMRIKILIDYAGAAAEELLTGGFSSGCMGCKDSDFEQAVQHIKQYLVMADKSLSKTMLDISDEKIIELSKKYYAESKNILKENMELLGIVSDYLERYPRTDSEQIKMFLEERVVVNGRQLKTKEQM